MLRTTNRQNRAIKQKFFPTVAPARHSSYRRRAFLKMICPLFSNAPPMTAVLSGVILHALNPPPRTLWSLDKSELRPRALSSDQRVGSFFCHASPHAERWIPKRLGLLQAQPQKIKLSKLVGGKECKGVKRTKKDGPSLKRLSAPTSDGGFRLAAGRRRLCCTCTCSRGRWGWPGGGKGRQLAGAGRSQQRSPRPVFCAR